MITSPRTLPQLVQSLPQELFDQIYAETFDWHRATIVVDKNGDFEHPPTALLRVNHATRSQLLRAFYENTRFVFAAVPPGDPSSRPDTMFMDFSRFNGVSVELTLFNDRVKSEVNDHLYPFLASLEMKGLCSNVYLTGRPIFRNHPVMWEHDVRIDVWGIEGDCAARRRAILNMICATPPAYGTGAYQPAGDPPRQQLTRTFYFLAFLAFLALSSLSPTVYRLLG